MAAKIAPVWFWIVGIVALLWNGMGVGAYFSQAMMTMDDLSKLRPEQQELIISQPFWLTAAFAIAVFSAFVGAILFLFRKRLAVRMFLLSMIAVFVQFGGLFFMMDYANVLQDGEWVMPIMIPIFAVGFWLIARRAEQDVLLT